MKEYIYYLVFRSSLPAEECREFSFKKYCDLLGLDYEKALFKAKRQFGVTFTFTVLFALVIF